MPELSDNLRLLYAEVDLRLPAEKGYGPLNALLKERPGAFWVHPSVKLPKGTTQKQLATLARKIYKETHA